MKVFKYPLKLVKTQTLKLPQFAEVYHVGVTSGGLYL